MLAVDAPDQLLDLHSKTHVRADTFSRRHRDLDQADTPPEVRSQA
jgi:hypothetical protein